jgi:hypothetical protein
MGNLEMELEQACTSHWEPEAEHRVNRGGERKVLHISR